MADDPNEDLDALIAHYQERVRLHDELTGPCADLRTQRGQEARDIHAATARALTDLRDQVEAERALRLAAETAMRGREATAARVAEMEAHLSEREAMHRRAQKAEGLLDRTMFILDGILKTYIYPETSLPLIRAVEAAHESARESSGRAFKMSHDFQRRKVQEAEARAEAAEAELARRGQVQVDAIAEIIRENLSGPMFDEPHIQADHLKDITETARKIAVLVSPGDGRDADLKAVYENDMTAILECAVDEYFLTDPLATEETYGGRRDAVRGMMVRLGLYDRFTAIIDRHAPPAPEGGA